MKYSNPEIKDGVNVSKGSPLGEFLRLLVAVALLLLVIGVLLAVFVGWAVKFVPMSFENELAGRFSQSTPVPSPQRDALQDLADRLAANMDLPEGTRITAHYVDGDTVNAFATVGGHVVFFKGLIESMQDENSLAMVMAHEIAHIEHRHPITSLGRGIAVMLTVMAVTGSSGSQVPDAFVNQLGLFSTMSFSRSQEREADTTGLAALQQLYGHVGGSIVFFRKAATMSDQRPPEILSTHPDPGNRVRKIRDAATAAGWPLDGDRTPLPEALTPAALNPDA